MVTLLAGPQDHANSIILSAQQKWEICRLQLLSVFLFRDLSPCSFCDLVLIMFAFPRMLREKREEGRRRRCISDGGKGRAVIVFSFFCL